VKNRPDGELNIDGCLRWGGAALTTALFDVICVLSFMFAARVMYEDVYNSGRIDGEFVMRIIIMVLAVSLLHELADNYGKLAKVLTVLGTTAAGAWWFYSNYLKTERRINKLISGFLRIAASYIDDWNDYYGTYFALDDEGSFSYVSDSLDVTMIALFFILLQVAKCRGKNRGLAFVPGIMFIAVLITGRAPGMTGLFLMLGGVFLAGSNGFKRTDFIRTEGQSERIWSWTRMFTWLRAGVLVAVVSLILMVTQSELAESTVRKHSEDIKRDTAISVDNTIKKLSKLEAVKEIELSGTFGEMVNSYAADVDTGIAKLNNTAPVYENEPVLEISLNKKPLTDMYLKSFCSGSYENGVWTRDEKAFEKACRAAMLDAKQMSEDIAMLAINKMERLKKVDSISDISIGNYGNIVDLTYTTAVNFPYAAKLRAKQPIEIKGDSWYTKVSTLKSVLVEMWNYSGDYEELLYLLEADDEDWESWYEQYVKLNYMAVPEYMTHVETVAKELLDRFNYSDSELNPKDRNMLRLQKAEAVVNWFLKNTRYSLDLPELPAGTDPVEYFLGSSKEGYCMHYASAATFTLRAIGVPARYAAGYIAEESSFRAMYTGYKSVVPDSNAHAWVEIYLDGIGWIPIEVTNSYSDRVDEPVEIKPDEPVVEQPTEPDTEEEQDEPEEPVVPVETQPTESDGGDDESKAEKDDKKDEDDSEESGNIWLVVLVMAGIIVIILAALCILIKIPAVRKLILEKEFEHFEKLEPRAAIQEMNRRLYKRLLLSGKVSGRNVGDDEFAEVLRKEYPNVEAACLARYMELVKAAVFAKREMTEEEMRFCYEVYRDSGCKDRK